MSVAETIISRMEGMADEEQASNLMRFFKTGPGQYGEGDRFLGIRVPSTRSIVKEYKKIIELSDIRELVDSRYHEIRLAGLLLLIELYNKAKRQSDTAMCRHIVDYYLSIIDRGNNWDLVDLVAPKILGDWLVSNQSERYLLYQLASMEGKLWHQRVAIVATMALICNGEYTDTLRLAEIFMKHRHDLIHKATGWMLREVGKRGGLSSLTGFLDLHAHEMPRTALRYSLERLADTQRRHYMSM